MVTLFCSLLLNLSSSESDAPVEWLLARQWSLSTSLTRASGGSVVGFDSLDSQFSIAIFASPRNPSLKPQYFSTLSAEVVTDQMPLQQTMSGAPIGQRSLFARSSKVGGDGQLSGGTITAHCRDTTFTFILNVKNDGVTEDSIFEKLRLLESVGRLTIARHLGNKSVAERDPQSDGSRVCSVYGARLFKLADALPQAAIDWDTGQITWSHRGMSQSTWLGAMKLNTDGASQTMSAMPVLINNEVYVPAEAFRE